MFYFEDTITQFEISDDDDSLTVMHDSTAMNSELQSEIETNDLPEDLLQRIRQLM